MSFATVFFALLLYAATLLGAAGLLNNKRCAIHWENLPGFQEAFPSGLRFSPTADAPSTGRTCPASRKRFPR